MRAFFVNNENYLAFLLNSQAQGLYGEINDLPNTMARGPQRRGAQCSCIGCIGLKAGPEGGVIIHSRFSKTIFFL